MWLAIITSKKKRVHSKCISLSSQLYLDMITATTDWLLPWQMIIFPFQDQPQITAAIIMGPFPSHQLTYLGGCSSIVHSCEPEYAPHPQFPETFNVSASPGAFSPSIDMLFQVRRNVIHHTKSTLKGTLIQIWAPWLFGYTIITL